MNLLIEKTSNIHVTHVQSSKLFTPIYVNYIRYSDIGLWCGQTVELKKDSTHLHLKDNQDGIRVKGQLPSMFKANMKVAASTS